ncbi:hypothetical protein C2I36_05270 [Rhodobacteraceae bacterium WD3A24]|nr:hypothetical protein C2I36_05270 [Rhodobacteraceae bacterium WD3A24]
MAHVIIRGNNGRRHEVDFDEADITVKLHASSDHVELVIESLHDLAPSNKKRFALANIPWHLFSKAMADLARQDPSLKPKPE